MKQVIRYIYTLIYSHVNGVTKKDLIETSNMQLSFFIVLSPITIIFTFIAIKLQIKNIVIALSSILIYVFGLNYLLNKLITIEVAEKYLIIDSKLKKNYLRYYFITFSLLLITLLLSATTVFICTKLLM